MCERPHKLQKMAVKVIMWQKSLLPFHHFKLFQGQKLQFTQFEFGHHFTLPIPIAYRDACDHSDQCYHYPQVCEQIQSQFSYSAKVERATNQISGHGEPICWKVISRETSTTFLCGSHFTILPLHSMTVSLSSQYLVLYVKRRPLKLLPHVPLPFERISSQIS